MKKQRQVKRCAKRAMRFMILSKKRDSVWLHRHCETRLYRPLKTLMQHGVTVEGVEKIIGGMR